MKETAFENRFVESMEKKFEYLVKYKIHGHEMQASGIPDYLLCVNGIFVAIEFKIQRDCFIVTTPRQIREINNIKNAKGIGLFIAWDEDRDKILIRERRLDPIKLMKDSPNKGNKISIKIDWDFDFNDYGKAVDLISVMVENVEGYY